MITNMKAWLRDKLDYYKWLWNHEHDWVLTAKWGAKRVYHCRGCDATRSTLS